MARIPVGGTATVDQLGKVATPGASAVLYLTRLGGTPIADVIDEAGAAIPGGIITIPADGIFPLVREARPSRRAGAWLGDDGARRADRGLPVGLHVLPAQSRRLPLTPIALHAKEISHP